MLEVNEPDRLLYLAVPRETYQTFFQSRFAQKSDREKIKPMNNFNHQTLKLQPLGPRASVSPTFEQKLRPIPTTPSLVAQTIEHISELHPREPPALRSFAAHSLQTLQNIYRSTDYHLTL